MNYLLSKGDSLRVHLGYKFSTRDQDNDEVAGHCAQDFKGAWWYKSCHVAHLNGRYLNATRVSRPEGVHWFHWKGYEYSLRFTEVKIRPF